MYNLYNNTTYNYNPNIHNETDNSRYKNYNVLNSTLSNNM